MRATGSTICLADGSYGQLSLNSAKTKPGAESASTFQCKLDAAAYAACTSVKVNTGASLGSHTFSVGATDAAGNMDASAATGTGKVLAFTFQGKGLKNIRLTVKDADGDTASTVKAITLK